jgi:hypothetical protein
MGYVRFALTPPASIPPQHRAGAGIEVGGGLAGSGGCCLCSCEVGRAVIGETAGRLCAQ